MNDELIKLAKTYMGKRSGAKLPREYARLYSQFSRLSMNQDGLATWKDIEATSTLDDAFRLIELGFLIKDSEQEDIDRTVDFRRAGELFEWLAHEKIGPDDLPATILAAACYQLAGLPARSSGLTAQTPSGQNSSDILKAFLKSDFPSLLHFISSYWSERPLEDSDRFASINDFVFDETTRALGVFCAEIRWGNQARLDTALEKLMKLYKVVLHGGDTYSWLLAYLCYEVAQKYLSTLLRYQVQLLSGQLGTKGKEILERYTRQSYIQKQSLAWPSQIRGVERLAKGDSFVLCTPTASGKTTVAELAILQSLFANDDQDDLLNRGPIVLYMVPSRALAFQLETKLAKVVGQLSSEDAITVTGLYGGNDWGPTDAWLTANDRTVLICTYEKAEALIHFLGSLFLPRLSLVIIDEAHQIIFDGNKADLIEGDSRSFRLEALTMRLLNYVAQNQNSKIIALSAAAFGVEQAMSGWATGNAASVPAQVNYRSTRQLIGRLICKPNRGFEIRYDILDGESLEFSAETNEQESPTPYVRDPFPPFPPAPELEKNFSALQYMYTFWAAFCFASSETKQSVMISVTTGIDDFTKPLINLLENDWNANVPVFFDEPSDPAKIDIWQNCLESCEDYFGKSSMEYRLLKKGIVVHQGQIPGKISKWLLDVISERIVRVVLATSTLTDGVNLPFEVILIPRLYRKNGTMPLQEFENLVGRAGRPGVSTEGKSLVVVTATDFYALYTKAPKTVQKAKKTSGNHINRYMELKNKFLNKTKKTPAENENSSLVALLVLIEKAWKELQSPLSFENWLETTTLLDVPLNDFSDLQRELDTLDGILLAAIVEAEQLSLTTLEPNELEQRLKNIWARSFAKYASVQEERLEAFFVRRGVALNTLYSADARRRIYSTSLPPRYATQLLDKFEVIKLEMAKGFEYWTWSNEEKYQYIQTIVNGIDQVAKFKLDAPSASLGCTWGDILHWWLDPSNAPVKPGDNVSQWLKFIYHCFVYKVGWGLGSILGLVANELHQDQIAEFNLEDWPQTNLPWIVFWIKELVHWGTLDPVASFLLSTNMEVTRPKAELFAQNYYQTYKEVYTPNDLLDPRIIKKWALEAKKRLEPNSEFAPPNEIKVELLRDFANVQQSEWRVIPAIQNNDIIWMDVAGYPLAKSNSPESWQSGFINRYDFILLPTKLLVQANLYV